MRHGQALSNVKQIIDCWPEKGRFPLTEEGKKQVKDSAQKLVDKKIDLIFASDLLRTTQTADIVGKLLKIKPKYDKRLREYNVGVLNGRPVSELVEFLEDQLKRFKLKPKKGETYSEIVKRMLSFLKDIDKKHKGKNILVISHQVPIILLLAKIEGLSRKLIFEKYLKIDKIKTAEVRELK